ncbi:MAG: UTP--glucose-1-phosphate uridylyltransferase [Treponemataceae bacterium]
MKHQISSALLKNLESKGVDVQRTLSVLDLIESKKATIPSISSNKLRVPDASDTRIIDRTVPAILRLSREVAERRLSELGLSRDCLPVRKVKSDFVFTETELKRIGTLLYPRVAYGVLNGGSATTYIDRKKNQELDPAAFALMTREFDAASLKSRDAPKGVTPAYVAADGSMGPSFLVLKMRSLLLRANEYRVLTGDVKTPVLPFFQMTSEGTDQSLRDAYRAYAGDPLLAPLIAKAGIDPTKALGGVQPLLAALTHSSDGIPRRIFDRAYGEENEGLALPGGHGENFRVLTSVYRKLRESGIRWAYLGNVDNSGYTVDPVSVALIALKGASAAFEFSWKTQMDVKGGILAERDDGKLSVAEIGQSIDKAEVTEAERSDKPILFNCATGLFDLDYLVPRLDRIVDELPIRVTDQDKEAGRYAQAEQNTWDIVGLLDDPLIFAVAKEKRFIAAKMLLETLLASPAGAKIDGAADVSPGLKKASARLRTGFAGLLKSEFSLDL